MSGENNKLPRLRFPEFRDAGDWEVEELREVAEFANHRKSISEIPLEQFVSTESLLPDYAGIKLATKLPPAGTATLFKKGDILISNIRPYLRKVWFSNKSGGTSNDVIVVRASTTGFSRYLSFVLINDGFINYVMEGAKGVKMPRGDIEQIKEFPVAFPKDKNEQQKIATCLTSLDDLITAQAQKLDSLKTHKKGLMQQLFPTEGETVPKRRFPEFQGAGDWEEKKLGNLSEIVRGGSPRPIDGFLTADRKGLNWLKIGDVAKNSKYVTHTQERVRIEALSKTREVNPGDLILSNSMSFGRPYILKIKSCIHDGWIAITQIDKTIYRDFLYYRILSSTNQAYFLNNAAGSGVQNLNADIIKLLPILFPQSPEQQKIADCQSSLDDLITVQAQKLDTLKTHKKGMMQQLFPTAKEAI